MLARIHQFVNLRTRTVKLVQYDVVFWLIVIVLTGGTLLAYVGRFPDNDPYSSLETFTRESTSRPFVYRVLLPLLSDIANHIVPLGPSFYRNTFIYIFFVGFVIALRSLALTFWKASRTLDYVLLLSIPLVIPFTIQYQHQYDVPVLCLFTWGIVCLARQRWTLFLIVYGVSCFNKETTLFLTFIFAACYYGQKDRRLYWRLIFMQLMMYGIVRVTLMYVFRDFPGGVVEYHLVDHVMLYWSQPIKAGMYLLGLGLVGAITLDKWHEKPLFLRKALLAVLPWMAVLFLLFGYPYEIRVFYELYAPLFLLCIPPSILSSVSNTCSTRE